MTTVSSTAENEAHSIADHGNLTQLEFLALSRSLNFADGHARQDLTRTQTEIISELPDLFAVASKRSVQELEREAFSSYFRLLGQHSFPTAEGRVLSCYSSSVAMEIVARSLITEMQTMALIHPTFDNIPDILKGVGMNLVPVAEERLHDGPLDAGLIGPAKSIFVTTPNNPTGRVLAEDRLKSLAALCARQGAVLVLDTSFRGFDTRAHYDHYAVLEASGCRWIVIEDTGKLWPTLDLKVGWLVTSANVGLPVAKTYSDILLGVSPFVLALITRLVEDAADDGLADLHRFIGVNRELVRSGLADVPGIEFPDVTSRGSVERILLGQRSGIETWTAMRDRNVYILPCQQFYWADPAAGSNALRVALARPTASLAVAVRVMRSVLLS